MPLEVQLEEAKARVSAKYHGKRYIAYFQAYTNTHAPVERLRALYLPIVQRDDIAVLDIATRPDCLDEAVYELLAELNSIKPVWIELGLQTSSDEIARQMNRCYPTICYDTAVRRLNSLGIHVITHVILGLPGETREDMLSTVRHVVSAGSHGIKLQLLHVLKGTALELMYCRKEFTVMSLDRYVDCVTECLALLPKGMVVHRLTGDGPKKLLIAPLWSGDKKKVLNTLSAAMRAKGLFWEGES